MSLSPGARLGPFEIISAIGAGAMGEVYRAWDTKLHVTSRSRSFRRVAADPSGSRDSSARPARWPRSITPTSPTSMASKAPASRNRHGVRRGCRWRRSSRAGRSLVDEALGSRNRSPRPSRRRTHRDRASRPEAGQCQGRPDGVVRCSISAWPRHSSRPTAQGLHHCNSQQ